MNVLLMWWMKMRATFNNFMFKLCVLLLLFLVLGFSGSSKMEATEMILIPEGSFTMEVQMKISYGPLSSFTLNPSTGIEMKPQRIVCLCLLLKLTSTRQL